MRRLIQPEKLRARWALWVEEQSKLGELPGSVTRLINALLSEGDIMRGDAVGLLAIDSGAADKVLDRLARLEVIGPAPFGDRVVLNLSIQLSERITPGLFP